MPTTLELRPTSGVPTPQVQAPVPGLTPPTGTATPPAWRGGAYQGPRPEGFAIPQFVTGADENQRWSNYLIYLQQNPTARGNRILHQMTGFQPTTGFTPPAQAPAAPAPVPAPAPAPAPTPAPGPPQGPPIGGRQPRSSPQPSPSPTMPVPSGYPPGTGMAGDLPAPNAFNNPFSMFLSAVPIMRANTQRALAQGMSDAGFTGNRWGTSAMDRAAQIGAESGMAENALLQRTLSDYANQVENRALQATPYGMQYAGQQEQMAQDRINNLANIGQWEQGRQDQYGLLGYQDFNQNRLQWFPHLLQAAMSQGAGTPGSIYQTQTSSGTPGVFDWASALGPLLGALI